MLRSHSRRVVSPRGLHEFAPKAKGAASVSADWSRLLLCLLVLIAGCNAWSERQLREDGPTPYVRCVAGPAPTARAGTLGGVSFELRERDLVVSHSATNLRLAVFGAAGIGGPPDLAALETLRSAQADVLLLLGGLPVCNRIFR